MASTIQFNEEVQQCLEELSESFAELREVRRVEFALNPVPHDHCQYLDEYLLHSGASLVLVDIAMLSYLPHLLTICPDGCKIGIIRGLTLPDLWPDVLTDYVGDVLAQALSGFKRFVGAVHSAPQAEELASGGPILQIRGLFGGSNAASVMTSIEWSDAIFEDVEPFYWLYQEIGSNNRTILYWASDLPLATGYSYKDYCYNQAMVPSKYLDSIVALDENGTFAFLLESEVHEEIIMAAIDPETRSLDMARDAGIGIKPIEVYVNVSNYDPRYYLSGDYVKARLETLDELATVIRRGTTVSAKSLDLGGIAFEPGTRHNGGDLMCLVSPLFPPERSYLEMGDSSEPLCYGIYADDLYYLDTNSLLPDNKFAPQVIREIPENQRLYTVTPEDGMVLLFSRNGRTFSFYEAPVPTLVSNALFIVKFKDGFVDPDYLSCVMRSYYVRAQLNKLTQPLSKNPLSHISIPIVDDEGKSIAVANNIKRLSEIAELRRRAADLENDDSLYLGDYGASSPLDNGEKAAGKVK